MFYFCEAPCTLLPWLSSTVDHPKLLQQYVEQCLHCVCYKHNQILLYVYSLWVELLPFEVWSVMVTKRAQKIRPLELLQIPKKTCRGPQARATRRDLLRPSGVTYGRMAPQKIRRQRGQLRPAHDGAMMSGPPQMRRGTPHPDPAEAHAACSDAVRRRTDRAQGPPAQARRDWLGRCRLVAARSRCCHRWRGVAWGSRRIRPSRHARNPRLRRPDPEADPPR